MGGGSNFGDIAVPDSNLGVESHYLRYGSYTVQYVGEELNPGTPSQGDVVTLTRQAVITIHYQEIIEYEPDMSPNYQSFECQQAFANQTVTFVFTAVPA